VKGRRRADVTPGGLILEHKEREMADEKKADRVSERSPFPSAEAPAIRKAVPVPIAFVGENLSGKSTIINNIVRQHFLLPVASDEERGLIVPVEVANSPDGSFTLKKTYHTKEAWRNMRIAIATIPRMIPADWRDGSDYLSAYDDEMMEKYYGKKWKKEDVFSESKAVEDALGVGEVTTEYENVHDLSDAVREVGSDPLVRVIRAEVPFPDSISCDLVFLDCPALDTCSYVCRRNTISQIAGCKKLFWVIPHDSRFLNKISYVVEGSRLASAVPESFAGMHIIMSKMDRYRSRKTGEDLATDVRIAARMWWTADKKRPALPTTATFPLHFSKMKDPAASCELASASLDCIVKCMTGW
jgi:hypothetical protein